MPFHLASGLGKMENPSLRYVIIVQIRFLAMTMHITIIVARNCLYITTCNVDFQPPERVKAGL